MLTLHQATDLTKNVLKIGGILITIILLGIGLFRGGQIIKEIFRPTPPPPPTVAFGKLKMVEFPVSVFNKETSYTIDTVTGKLPDFPDRIKVYKILQPEPNLLALKRADAILNKVGFKSTPIFLGNNYYGWTSQQEDLSKQIDFNILSYNFKLSSSNYLTNSNILASKNLPDQNQAINTAKTFLADLSIDTSDLDENKTKTTLYSISNSELVETLSLSSTQVILVNFFQKDVDNSPIYYPNAPFSSLSLLVAGGKYNGQVVQGDYFHQNIATESATYPIKTAEEAFNALKNGEAYITQKKIPTSVSLKNVFLAYYLGNTQQEYLMPVIVFEGNNNFYAYVPAIKDEWLIK